MVFVLDWAWAGRFRRPVLLHQVPPTTWIVECLQQLQLLLLTPAPAGQNSAAEHVLDAPAPAVPAAAGGGGGCDGGGSDNAIKAAVAAALQAMQGGNTSTSVGTSTVTADSPASSSTSSRPGHKTPSSSQAPAAGPSRILAGSSHDMQCTAGNSSSSNSYGRGSNGGSSSSYTGIPGSSNSQLSTSHHSRPSQDLANTIWALAKLRVKPNAAWMESFLAASGAALCVSTPQELTNTIWALARLKVVTPAWLAAFDAASLAAMEGFTPQALADILSAQVSFAF